MTAKDVRNRLTGVFGFPITPFRKDLSLDLDALGRNVADMVKHPFCALVAAGGTGELYSMTPDEIADVIDGVPSDWGLHSADRKALLDFLVARKDKVRNVLQTHLTT